MIQEIYFTLGTAPGAALHLNVRKNGSAIISGYVEIASENNTATATSLLDTAIANNDYFQVEVIQGNANASDLAVHIRYI